MKEIKLIETIFKTITLTKILKIYIGEFRNVGKYNFWEYGHVIF